MNKSQWGNRNAKGVNSRLLNERPTLYLPLGLGNDPATPHKYIFLACGGKTFDGTVRVQHSHPSLQHSHPSLQHSHPSQVAGRGVRVQHSHPSLQHSHPSHVAGRGVRSRRRRWPLPRVTRSTFPRCSRAACFQPPRTQAPKLVSSTASSV